MLRSTKSLKPVSVTRSDELRIVSGLMQCAYMTRESCTLCPYGDDVPDSCFKLRREAAELIDRLREETEHAKPETAGSGLR